MQLQWLNYVDIINVTGVECFWIPSFRVRFPIEPGSERCEEHLGESMEFYGELRKERGSVSSRRRLRSSTAFTWTKPIDLSHGQCLSSRHL